MQDPFLHAALEGLPLPEGLTADQAPPAVEPPCAAYDSPDGAHKGTKSAIESGPL